MNIAYSHALLAHHREALALLLRAESLASTALAAAKSSLSSPSSAVKQLDIDPKLIQALQARLVNLISRQRALVELDNLAENSRLAAEKHMTSSAPIVERLNDYPPNGVDLKNLVEYPPKVKPVPVKPLFFDVAWNYIEYPGRASRMANGEATKAGDEKPREEKRRGWFGWGGRS